MNTIRLFIDLPLDPGLAKQLTRSFLSLNLPWSKLKTSGPEQMHLTLKFLGNTPIEQLPLIIEALQSIDLKLKDIELEIDQPIIFNEKTPKALVLGIKANQKLKKLFNTIEQTLFEAGLAHKEIRNFTAHLTLARVKQTATHEEFKDFLTWKVQGRSTTAYFELQESVLTKKGSEYLSLQTFDL